MKKEIIQSIVDCMAANKEMSDIQKIQTRHRVKLAEFWKIGSGDKILEVGCGQGDTTAVLAYFTGEKGLVHGMDIGSPTYGAPISLGDSAAHLMESDLGKQIKMEFEVDILSANIDFPENSFDCIVLSHCSWYMKSAEEFTDVLKKARKWGKRLCFAEWDTRIQGVEQYPHLLAILIQAQYESFKTESDSNVRTLFTANDIKEIINKAGWNLLEEQTVYSPDLQDGKWEVDQTLETDIRRIPELPDKLRKLVQSEVTMLRGSIKSSEIKPLNVFAFVAE
ncbi:SAM-dependent methyltransferase [Virgibacillus indicus]|uniref:SAM-dependent methyltransferase n=1 Tax=Virgibacillus indicus TaxID=2024554 RepID=A0A265NBC5_9BACI|nr:class I SAM-dependent methyltransferase [Virgibacillus indicus]OZU89328.1 SAM-dependent methyltransferase [Virgibacillus indicus]